MSKKWNLASLKDYFELMFAERDNRYMQMFKSSETAVSTALAAQEKAVNAALAAQEKAVGAAFEASEKAIVKAENAQTAYNVRSNEFRAALDDQSKSLLSRTEADVRFNQLSDLNDSQLKRITELEKFQSGILSSLTTKTESKSTNQWTIVLVASILMFLFGGIASLIFFLVTKH